jgi:hypothetical protein
LTLAIAAAIIGIIGLLSVVPVVGTLFDFIGELGSGPRFIYMSFSWLFSEDYRRKIRQEYRRRNKVMAWLEYSLAATSLLAWLVLIFYVANNLAGRIV